ncbi:tryptophan halogenase [Advenella sp. S44]|uniref:NAD(P)/FAD-dependent oxidoreductase n=1 Tax=Advenella sp. S44 TaxID=1982755 RepID=UPI000C2AC619|nr:NAD(P)/FAD-dependent oxidoreductase [Advenella sp. S44]PJX27856.1 tryptophan halogenase [Advenella sp. S44]
MESHHLPATTDIAIIGAGPSGSVAAALLRQQGWQVCVLERQHFPRFSIGESLLPYCMEILKEAGLLQVVNEAGFQIKNGAAFTWGERQAVIDFRDKFTAGPGTTFQVERAKFDQILIQEAANKGAQVYFGHTVTQMTSTQEHATLSVSTDQGQSYTLQARFVLDASGYGRVLPRLLNLEQPSPFPMREAWFTHIQDNISDPDFDREKIVIATHPHDRAIWMWLIPFSHGRCSIGVVGEPDRLAMNGREPLPFLQDMVNEIPRLRHLLADAKWDTPVNPLRGYSANVTTLYGQRFALLGNAAEFLDPVFSSGVTIAMHSAKLATTLVDKTLRGQAADWQRDFSDALRVGIDTFRTYVAGWYDCRFQDVIYSTQINQDIRRMIAAILAGYAWDTSNPYVEKSERRLRALAEICGEAQLDT